MKDKLLEVKDLEIIYETDIETIFAVNKINFSLKKGETLGIVGETGAGKTTTALGIMRLLPERVGKVVGGTINFDGVNLLDIHEIEMREMIGGERISMIFQDSMTSLNPIMTVGEQIAEAIIFHNEDNMSKKEIEKKVDETLELVGIPASRRNEYPHQFSGGMKQRVVIAIGLVLEPELLIADEPTTALDVTIQAQVLIMMDELIKKLGMGMIFISHDLGVISEVSDNVAIMYAGEIIEYGSLEEIFLSEKRHPYTDGLFKSIPNLIVESDRLSPIRGLMPDPSNLPKGCKFSPRCEKRMEICSELPPQYVENTHMIACHLYKNENEEL